MERRPYDSERVRTTDELVEALESDDSLRSIWAAEELAASDQPDAKEALARVLEGDVNRLPPALLSSILRGVSTPASASTVLSILVRGKEDPWVGPAACAALGRIGSRSEVPALASMFTECEVLAEELGPLIARLDPMAALSVLRPFLRVDEDVLLDEDPRSLIALRVLGELADRASVSAFIALAAHELDEVAVQAIVALARVDPDEAEPRLLAHLESGRSLSPTALPPEFGRRPGVARALSALAGRLASPERRAGALLAAAGGGDGSAHEALRSMLRDGAATSCARGFAAIALTDLDDAMGVEALCQLLRRNSPHSDADERDPYVSRTIVQTRGIEALARCARRQPDRLVDLCDTLDWLRRESHGLPVYARQGAQKAIEQLTGTELFSQYAAWRSARS